MKRFSFSTFGASGCLIGVSLALLLSCRDEINPSRPFSPWTPPDTAGKNVILPDIVDISIPGLPKENVVLDRQQKTVTIILPDTIPFSQFRFEMTTTAGVNVEYDGRGGIVYHNGDPYHYATQLLSGGLKNISLYLLTKEKMYKTIYNVVIQTPGPLTVRGPDKVLEYLIQDGPVVVLKVKNIAGKPAIRRVRLTPGNGAPTLEKAITLSEIFWYEKPNQLSIRLNGLNLQPGIYQMALMLADSQEIKVPEPIINEGGTLDFEFSFSGRALVGQGRLAYMLDDVNFDPRRGEFRLTKAFGQREYRIGADRLSPHRYDRNLRYVSGPLVGLEPGNYMASFYVDGKEVGLCRAVSILRTKDQPHFGSIGTPSSYQQLCTPDGICLLLRGANQWLGIPYFATGYGKDPDYFSATLSQLKLVSLENDKSFYIPVVLPKVVETFPGFRVPDDFPAGRYRMTYQIHYGGKQLESDPFMRVIEVQ